MAALERSQPYANPERPDVTDRALRYSAVQQAPPRTPCLWCGRKSTEVAHVNGHEEDTRHQNLGWTCRSCNVKCGITLRDAGLGRRTRQYNPHTVGAQTLGAWLNAVQSMKGEPGGTMDVAEAVALIHATPQDQRSNFAKEIWAVRRKRGTDTVVPF